MAIVTGKNQRWRVFGAHAFLIVLLVVTLFPLAAVISISLRPGNFANGSLIPREISLEHWKLALGFDVTTADGVVVHPPFPVLLWLWNSVKVATIASALIVAISTTAAYAFARLKFPGRDKIFFLFLTAMMIPPIFTLIPNFVLIKNLGLLNSFAGIILPGAFMTPFAIFFLRQFFLGINRELEEAAMIDGAGHRRIFFGLIIPMSGAPIATLAILTYINSWNDYFWPLLVGQQENVRVLTVALGVFRSQTPQGGPDWAGLMAATLIAALPMIILFLAFAKRITNSIGFSGIK